MRTLPVLIGKQLIHNLCEISFRLRKAHWWTAINHCVCVCVRRVCDTQLGQCAMRLELVRVSLCAKQGSAISGYVLAGACVCVWRCLDQMARCTGGLASRRWASRAGLKDGVRER